MAQSDYTHYRLFKIPSDIIIEVDGVAALENTWYANTLDIVAKKNAADDYGEPYTDLEYQTTDGDVVSPVTPIRINLQVNVNTPASISQIATVLNDSTTPLFPEMPINDSTDRIQIISFGPTGQLFLNNSLANLGQEILRKDLINFEFIAGSTGFGDTYNQIKYVVGNKDGYSPTEYICTIKIVGQASLGLSSTEDGVENDGPDFSDYTYNLKIENGIPLGTSNVNIALALDGTAGVDSYIKTSLTGDTEYTNGNFNINPILNEITGELSFSISLRLDNADRPETGTIIITLVDIDGNVANVSGTNIVTVNLSLL